MLNGKLLVPWEIPDAAYQVISFVFLGIRLCVIQFYVHLHLALRLCQNVATEDFARETEIQKKTRENDELQK